MQDLYFINSKTMDTTKSKLIGAEAVAYQLFTAGEGRKLITPDKSEKKLNEAVFKLAEELYGIKKYWHKRIVRSGIKQK